MATQITNIDFSTLAPVQIIQNALLAEVLPASAIGELIRFSVRDNQTTGKGLILINGNLIPATLPPQLEQGDAVTAKITANNEQLILKIIDTVRTKVEPKADFTQQIATELEKFVNQPGTPGLRPLNSFPILTQNLVTPELPTEVAQKQINPESKEIIKLLTDITNTIIQNQETLTDPERVFSQLLAATTGTLANELKESAQSLRQLVENQTPPTAQRILLALQSELSELLRDQSDNQTIFNRLTQLTDIFIKELKDNKTIRPHEKELLQAFADELEGASQDPEGAKAKLEQIVSRLQESILSNFERNLNAKDGALNTPLQQIATRLDQIANLQETLNKLNPLMQAMGEPALILFPFVLQGLLSHSEVTIENKTIERKKDDEGNGGKGSNEKSEPYQRIQVNVPLPTMGNVGVDIAHRSKEILVRFTVEDEEVGGFLLEQLENLAVILREQGFERAELVAHVGKASEALPTWALGLHSNKSIIA